MFKIMDLLAHRNWFYFIDFQRKNQVDYFSWGETHTG